MPLTITPPFGAIGTPPFDLSNAAYDGSLFSVSSHETQPSDIEWKPDGTRFFITGALPIGPGPNVRQYDTVSPWVIPASTTSGTLDVSSSVSLPSDVEFKPDGTRMFVLDRLFPFDVTQYATLSTPWDVTTASGVSTFAQAQDSEPHGLAFKPDGTKMYIVGNDTNSVYQYTLSTPWLITTASYDSVSFSVVGQESIPSEVEFSADGTKMFVCGPATSTLYQYTLTVAWDLSTASYSGISFNFTPQDNFPRGVAFRPDGKKLWMIGESTMAIYQYRL